MSLLPHRSMDTIAPAADDAGALATLARRLPYPPGIRHVEPGAIRGCAFFPGGTGILVGPVVRGSVPGRTLPVGGVLVLGHNFHDVGSYEDSVRRGHELDTPTWRNLSNALAAFDIPHDACFFSNALMGLMERAGACGTHEGHRDQAFRAGCVQLLQATLTAQRPRLVLALGKYAPGVLAEAVPGLDAWRRAWTFPSFDTARLHEVGLKTFLPETSTKMACVVLTHPSLGPSNVTRRSLDGLRGLAAETEMVNQAKRACGLT